MPTSLFLPNLNLVVIAGRLTQDPDMRTTPSGTPVCNIQLAVNRRYKNRQGEWVEEPTFIGAVMWGEMAERCKDRLKKGSPVLIHGSLRSSSWEREGQKRSRIEILVNRIQLLEKDDKTSATEELEVVDELAEVKDEPSEEVPF